MPFLSLFRICFFFFAQTKKTISIEKERKRENSNFIVHFDLHFCTCLYRARHLLPVDLDIIICSSVFCFSSLLFLTSSFSLDQTIITNLIPKDLHDFLHLSDFARFLTSIACFDIFRLCVHGPDLIIFNSFVLYSTYF